MKETFAARARALKKKYKRAEYDELEKKELIEELRKLRDEQESFRADNGIDVGEGQSEEVEQYDGITNVSSFLPATAPRLNMDLSKVGLAGATSPEYGPITSSILPSLISTGSSLLGNILGANKANKLADTEQINIPRIAPEQISLEPQREAMRRDASTATNIALRNARDVSSPGAAYANQVAGVGSIYDSLGTGLGQSYMTEQNTNAQMRQSANQSNLESDLRGSMFNAQLRSRYLDEASAYRDAAFQAIPEGLRDYRAQRSQDQWMSTMGKDYGLYQKTNPNATFKEKLLNSLFGNPYSIKNREYINSLNNR